MAFNFNDPNSVIKARQAAIDAGYSSKEVDAFIQKKKQLQTATEIVNSGTNIKDVPVSDDVKLEIQRKIAAGEIKAPQQQVQLKGTSASDVNFLRNIISTAQGAAEEYDPKYTGFVDSKIGALRTTFGGEKNQPEAEFRSDIADIRTAVRNLISGAAISKFEAKEFEDLIPKTSDSDVQVRAKLKKLQERSIQKVENILQTAGYDVAGKEYLKTDIKAPEGGLGQRQGEIPAAFDNPIMQFLFGSAVNIAQDTGAGITARSTQGARDQANQSAFQQAKQLENAAIATDDMNKRKELLRQANTIYSQISKAEGDVSRSFSPDVEMHPLLRAALGATEIGTLAGAPGIGKTATSIGKKVISSPRGILEKVFTQGAGSNLRNIAVETAQDAGKLIQGDDLFNAVDDWAIKASKANPASTKTIAKYVDGAKRFFQGKQITPEEAFSLWDEAGKGFTAAGKKGASLESSYHRVMRDTVRKVLDDVAPGFEEGTQMIKKGLGRKKIVTGVGKQAASTVIGVGSTLAALKALGLLGIGNDQGGQ